MRITLANFIRGLLTSLLLGVGLVGCVNFEPKSRPDLTRFYVLSGTNAPVLGHGDFDVSIRRVTLPGYLDRSPIVIRVGPHEVRYRVFHRWSGELNTMIAEALADGIDAAREEGSATTGLMPGVEHYMDIQILSFEGSADGDVVVSFEWRLFRAGQEASLNTGRIVKNGSWDGEEIGDLVDTLARLLHEAAADLARVLPQSA